MQGGEYRQRPLGLAQPWGWGSVNAGDGCLEKAESGMLFSIGRCWGQLEKRQPAPAMTI